MAKALAVLVAVLAVVAAMSASGVSAQDCNAGSLAVCAGPILSGSPPSGACCSNLRAQRGCFCQFARNPAYGTYINSPNARKTLSACNIAVPRC
ncbi:hypothetical protein PR202_gb07134 [Eleusine coracana subsp. coracana]|uniref:Bifunctional inhibitor/plant lipid transfer protein/seed storage helical domain-containing protein n=1 Tax=Eleusine coracana subsp. coracana TaxID=191504 RepID=A0AAV5E9M6_ELECO|nr:hypothetical protein QOZ80_2BG0166330 [Eleusine coracana subsp. coracana]GJN19824.1 hypothetical protein PR202_gb07134 [Eleusine coracana subsp. coracana]